jgi:Carboxypeptidase regulatory-like domain
MLAAAGRPERHGMGFAKLFPFFFCLASLLRWAQSQFATVNGTVTDASGSIVPGAVIRVVNLQTGENWSAITNDHGNYVFPLVKPGVYRLTAEQTGFKQSEQTGIELETGMQVRIDVKLEIGTVSDRVVVEAAAPLLQSESSAVGAVVENRTIINMPLIDRRAAQLALFRKFGGDPRPDDDRTSPVSGKHHPCEPPRPDWYAAGGLLSGAKRSGPPLGQQQLSRQPAHQQSCRHLGWAHRSHLFPERSSLWAAPCPHRPER